MINVSFPVVIRYVNTTEVLCFATDIGKHWNQGIKGIVTSTRIVVLITFGVKKQYSIKPALTLCYCRIVVLAYL